MQSISSTLTSLAPLIARDDEQASRTATNQRRADVPRKPSPSDQEWLDREVKRAAKEGKFPRVLQLLRSGASLDAIENLNLRDSNGQTLLHHAAKATDLPLTRRLVEQKKVDITVRDDGFGSAYQFVKHYSDQIPSDKNLRQVADYLGKVMADLLPEAVLKKDQTRGAGLLKAGADPRIKFRVEASDPAKEKAEFADEVSLLSYAAGTAQNDTVQAALAALAPAQRAAAINSEDAYKRTPMHYAAYSGNPDAYEMLRKAGGNDGWKDKWGNTPKSLLDRRSGPALAGEFYENDILKNWQALRRNGTDLEEFETFTASVQAAGLLKYVKSDQSLWGVDKGDLAAHPEKYSAKQRYGAIAELTLAYHNIVSQGVSLYRTGDHKWEEAKFNNLEFLLEDLGKLIVKLNDDEVEEYRAKHEPQWMQAGINAGMQENARWAFDVMTRQGAGVEGIIDKSKGKEMEALRRFLTVVETLNLASGRSGLRNTEEVVIDVTKRDSLRDKVQSQYQWWFRNSDVLSKLVRDEGMTEEQALLEMVGRGSVFLQYGAPAGDVVNSMKDNVLTYYLERTTGEELIKTGLITTDGKFNEKFAERVLREAEKASVTEWFGGPNKGGRLKTGQIILAARSFWDSYRELGKINHVLMKQGGKGLVGAEFDKLYGVGAMHAVSSIFGAAAALAKGTQGPLSDTQKANAIGNGIQSMGLIGEAVGMAWGSRAAAWRHEWGTLRPGLRPDFDYRAQGLRWTENFRNFAKFLNASGGMMAGVSGIMLGIAELKRGNKFLGGVMITQGALGSMTTVTPFAEAMIPYVTRAVGTTIAPSALARFAALGGGISLAANVAAVVLVIAFAIWDSFEQEKKRKSRDEYFDLFAQTLVDYKVNGERPDRPDPINEEVPTPRPL